MLGRIRAEAAAARRLASLLRVRVLDPGVRILVWLAVTCSLRQAACRAREEVCGCCSVFPSEVVRWMFVRTDPFCKGLGRVSADF
ncbi:MAG: hypothetical protein ACKO0W_00550, partial [Planctomycetota bacterium]